MHMDVGIYIACACVCAPASDTPTHTYRVHVYLPAVTPHGRPDSRRPGFLEPPTLTSTSGKLSQRTGPCGQIPSCVLAQQPVPEPLADGASAPTRRSVHTRNKGATSTSCVYVTDPLTLCICLPTWLVPNFTEIVFCTCRLRPEVLKSDPFEILAPLL